MSIEISYKGNVIASVEDGKKAIVRCNDDKMKGDIEVVSTSSETPTQEKTIDITENGTVVVEPDEGHTMSKVTANVDVKSSGVNPFQLYIYGRNGNGKNLFEGYIFDSVDDVFANVDTNSITDASRMFAKCSALTSIPPFDTSNVTSMGYMFTECSSLTSIPLFDTRNVTNISGMFNGCDKLTTVPLFDTSNVTDMSYMFQNCSTLQTIPLFDTSNVTNMSFMLQNCSALQTVPLFDTSNVTNMSRMFISCKNLTSIPLLDTSNVTNMYQMFSSCSALQTVTFLDTSNVTDAWGLFNGCANLTTVKGVDIRKITGSKAGSMLSGTEKLTECYIRNIGVNLQVGSGTTYGHLLTLESLLHLCKECRKTTSSLKLTVGSANLEKLANVYVKLIDITDDMRAEDDLIDEKSPFVVCESTDEGAMLVSDYMATKMWQLA